MTDDDLRVLLLSECANNHRASHPNGRGVSAWCRANGVLNTGTFGFGFLNGKLSSEATLLRR